MNYKNVVYALIFLAMLCVGCTEDKNYKEYFPGPNGEKPEDFVYSFRKDYKLAKADSLKFIKSVQVFAERKSMYKGGQVDNSGGPIVEYYVAGPPMKFLLQIVKLERSHYRVQISNYPGRECTLCNDFIKDIDSIFSGTND